MTQSSINPAISKEFFSKRLHSLMGLWIVLFLIEHLFTNSQAALWFGNEGSGFVRAVDAIQNLPFLYVIEILLIGVPFLIHFIWGLKYLWTAKFNVLPSDGTKPALTKFYDNHAYSWQRITAWILVLAIAGHVIQMRFVNAPSSHPEKQETTYIIKLSKDPELEKLAIQKKMPLKEDSNDSRFVFGIAPDFGTAELFAVRDTFKMPMMRILYSLFVLAACFHAFNGLWSFFITWGIVLSERGQRIMRIATVALMFLITSLGMAAIWGSY